MDFSKLAEARIREWMQRPESARRSDDPDARRALTERAARIETQIMVLLEESGRPLAAQQFAKMLADEREKAR